MKPLLHFFIICPLISFAQITITQNNFPSNGDEYIYSNANTNGIDISQTGANMNWDYSQLTSINYDTLSHVAVSSTPLAYQFFFNIPFSSYQADYAIKGQDIQSPDPTNMVSISEVFDFHKKNNTSIEMVGFGANINGIPASIKYDTIDQLYPLPLTYGTNDSTSAYYLLDVPSLGTYGQHIQRKVEVDGWGSITTPYQNYSQSLRVVTTLYQRDTLLVLQPIPLPGVAFNRPIQTTYEWFVSGIGAPVFSVTQQTNITSNAKFIDINTTDINKHESFELEVFPNPATDLINISIPYEKATMTIVELNGKIVFNGQYSKTINISNYSKGNYILIIAKDDKKAYRYFQKI